MGIASEQRSVTTVVIGMNIQNILLPPQWQSWEHVAGPAFMPGTKKLWTFGGEIHLQHLTGTAGEQKPPV